MIYRLADRRNKAFTTHCGGGRLVRQIWPPAFFWSRRRQETQDVNENLKTPQNVFSRGWPGAAKVESAPLISIIFWVYCDRVEFKWATPNSDVSLITFLALLLCATYHTVTLKRAVIFKGRPSHDLLPTPFLDRLLFSVLARRALALCCLVLSDTKCISQSRILIPLHWVHTEPLFWSQCNLSINKI